MKLKDYLLGIALSSTSEELETAIQVWKDHPYSGRAWERICNARIKAGNAIVGRSTHGRFVPAWSPYRKLTVCGEDFRIGKIGNAAGYRYAMHYAKQWAIPVLQRNGLSLSVAEALWESDWSNYPHRSLEIVDRYFAMAEPGQRERMDEVESSGG